MLTRDIEMFIEHCGLKGLSTKTINSYEQTLRLFMQYMDEQGILLTEKITHLAIQGYIKSIKERGKYTVTTNPNSGNYPDRRVDFGKRVSDVTINNYLRNLRVFFNWCVEEELILRSPVKKGDFVKVERKPLEFVSDEDFKRLLKSMNSASFSEYRDSIIIQLLLDTGMRVNECLLIEVTDLDMVKRCISLPADNTKGKKARYVFFSDKMATQLQRWIKYTFGLDFETMSGSFASYKRTYQYKMESALEIGNQNTQGLLDAMTRMDSLQTQVDSSICSWFYPGVPTAENYPAVEWTTPEAKHAHIGDLYYDKSTGIGYRWTENSGGYYWDVIEDKQVQQALQDASRAQSTADGKVRCFSTQPYPPYEVGDLWVQGGSGDILCCQHDRESGSYVASDWVRASKYTDDTKAIEAGKTATDYIKDGAGGIQVGPNGSSNVTMTDEGLVFNGIRNLIPLWENADPTSGMAGGTVICSDGRLASYAAIAIGCQEYYTSPFDSASTEGGLIQYTIVVLNGKEARCSYVWDKSRARKVTASKNGITFGPGGYYDTKKLDKWIWPWTDVTYGAKFNAHNQCCVPVVVYGFL